MVFHIIMSIVEVAFLILFLCILIKLHLDEQKAFDKELELIELEENTENLIYMDDYRKEAK